MKRLFVLAFVLAAVSACFAQFTFTSIDFPGSNLTTARGINNHGDVVGSYRLPGGGVRHAMLLSKGVFSALLPDGILGQRQSEAFKINDRGDIVGQFLGEDGLLHGFLLTNGGTFTVIDMPGFAQTHAFGINSSGTVAGYGELFDADGNVTEYHGFVWQKGAFTRIDFLEKGDTAITGINERGDVVGMYDGGIADPNGHAFVISNTVRISYDVPVAGITLTQFNDINAQGQIVGSWLENDGITTHAFLLSGAAFAELDFPNATPLTSAWGINSLGQVVGTYQMGGPSHGFLAQPRKGQPY